MKAAVVEVPGRFTVRDVADPVCPPDGVILRVHATTLCPTDLKRSLNPNLPQPPPIILGHELAGTIAEAGKNVTGWKAGDRVGLAPRISCGRCPPCVAGHTNLCKHNTAIGWHRAGSFAEYIVVPGGVPMDVLVRLPADLPFESAALAEPLACALNSVEVAGVTKGDDVVILGMGCQGVMQAQLARHFGARTVLGVMRSAKRIEIVRRCATALDELIISSEQSPMDAVNKYTDGEGASVVFVSASSGEALQLAKQLVRWRGRICVHASIPSGEETLPVDANKLHYREWTVTGSSSFKQRQYVQSLELIRQRVISADGMIGARLPLAEIEHGVALMKQRAVLKVAINP
jgi:L-iditol 2-dehydrogenase